MNATNKERADMLNKLYEIAHEMHKMHDTIYNGEKEYSRIEKSVVSTACQAINTMIDVLF